MNTDVWRCHSAQPWEFEATVRLCLDAGLLSEEVSLFSIGQLVVLIEALTYLATRDMSGSKWFRCLMQMAYVSNEQRCVPYPLQFLLSELFSRLYSPNTLLFSLLLFFSPPLPLLHSVFLAANLVFSPPSPSSVFSSPFLLPHLTPT